MLQRLFLREIYMARLISGIWFVLMPLLAIAADVDAPPPQPVDVSPWGMILFAIIFVGMIVGFIGYVWWKERSKKQGQARP